MSLGGEHHVTPVHERVVEQEVKVLARLRQEKAVLVVLQRLGGHVTHRGVTAGDPGVSRDVRVEPRAHGPKRIVPRGHVQHRG